MTPQRTRISPRRTVRRAITARTATPEGGARTWRQEWVRGCATLAVILCAHPVIAQDVPSGQDLSLAEVLIDEVGGEAWLRFRFLAPQIARQTGTITYGDAEDDFAHLCDAVARPYLLEHALAADVIAITLMDRAVPFGQADPDATQFIEVFRIENDACVWELL